MQSKDVRPLKLLRNTSAIVSELAARYPWKLAELPQDSKIPSFRLALLDVRATHGALKTLVHHVPVDLVEDLIDIVSPRHDERALAIRNRGEKLEVKAARCHVRCKPDPALTIINNLVCLICEWANTTLADE